MATAISSRVNQYLGVNAHLHSYFMQNDRQGWEEFHRSHLTDLTRAFNTELFDKGYVARQERSLQIQFFDEENRQPHSDVIILDTGIGAQSVTPGRMSEAIATAPALPARLLRDLEESELKRPFAIKIYERDDRRREAPVAWIELLSPSNKEGKGAKEYAAKRDALLTLQIVFVELDYLHGTSTSLDTIPDYLPKGRTAKPSPDAYPYHIWMIDPRIPDEREESGALVSFPVDTPIPRLTIPLNRGDSITFDFNAVYHLTYRSQPVFGLEVDYARPPVNVNADYNVRDLRAIAARMLTVQKLAAQGVDLSQGPFPVDYEVMSQLETDMAQVHDVLRFA